MRPRDGAPRPPSTLTHANAETVAPDGSERISVAGFDAEQALEFILSTAEQGILVTDAHTVLVANPRVAELLDYPRRLVRAGADYKAFLTYGERRGDFKGNERLPFDEMLRLIGTREAIETERKLPNGRVVRVDSRARGPYRITTYTDVTAARLREDQLRRSRAKIHQLAVNDGLTGILNRRTFDSRLAEVLTTHYRAPPSPVAPRPALIALDLDGFKAVNDTRG
ncbi:MAG: PAS-domain containing protein, partial [Pseudomonadota bacterium]